MAFSYGKDLSNALFPVEKRPIYIKKENGGTSSGKLFDDGNSAFQAVPNFTAIIDMERNHTFAVVSKQYRLVTNHEAVKMGQECFRKLFSLAKVEDMDVFNIIMPQTRSFCHIDFLHKNHILEPWKGDTWWPYLRVTNSYNRTKQLSFDLGFCRSICTNGVIFGKENIPLRYYHTINEIAPVDDFEVDIQRLRNLEVGFFEQLKNLKRYYVPQEHMLALACKVFRISVNGNTKKNDREWERLLKFRDDVLRLSEKYFNEFGPNGYAALNVLSDIASRPTHYISHESMIDPLQKKCGDWVENFIGEIEKPSFDFSAYLGESLNSAKAMSA